MQYEITRARAQDLAALPSIELAAAQLLTGYAPASVLAEVTSPQEFAAARQLGHLWVALVKNGAVGFAHVEVLEPRVAHLKEIDVLPEYGKQGIGSRLIKTVVAWAMEFRYSSITLTTFRDVPWNMPFYARLGFEVISPEDLTPVLRAIVEDEARRGLDPRRRVAMRKALR